MFGAPSAILLSLSLAACGSGTGDDGTGLSPGEASELNAAAAELDARPQAPQNDSLNGTDPGSAGAD